MKKSKKSLEINTNTIIYQNKNGSLEFKTDNKNQTIWANLNQIAEIFDTDKSGISRHIKNILETKELVEDSTVAKIATVQKEGKREILRNIEYYNLDMIISIGYRVNSKIATEFRIWATKTLKSHLIEGFTINKNKVKENYEKFNFAVNEIKKILPSENFSDTKSILELISFFSETWLSLDSYDKGNFDTKKTSKKQVKLTADDLEKAINNLKEELIKKGEATDIFATDRNKKSLEGIVGNVMQSFGGKYVYESLEEKAVHLLYFIVKNHPFIDGNKRSGAFAFVWFLQKTKILNKNKISPEALTSITLLIAESSPQDKDRIIKLLIMLLSNK